MPCINLCTFLHAIIGMIQHVMHMIENEHCFCARDVKSSRPTWPQDQNFRPQPSSIQPRPRPLAMLALFSHRLSVIEIMSFTLRSSLIGNCCLVHNIVLKLTVEQCMDTAVTAIVCVISWYYR